MEGYVSRTQANVRLSRLHDGSIHDRRVVFITSRARVYECASLRAYIDFHKAPALGELAMAGRETKEPAHGSWRRRFDGSFPVRRDSSVPTFESKIFALVPSRIWHWVL
jgi:hypothetical protein